MCSCGSIICDPDGSRDGTIGGTDGSRDGDAGATDGRLDIVHGIPTEILIIYIPRYTDGNLDNLHTPIYRRQS